MGSVVQWAILVALAWLWPAPAAAEQRAVDFHIAESDPGLAASLALGDGLYVRIAYRSDRPVRFRMEGYADGIVRAAGVMYNVAPSYPPGVGQALVWIAYRRPAAIDEIHITALDERWQPLASLAAPVDLQWSSDLPRRKRAEWATRMAGEQQDAARHAMERRDGGGGAALFFLLVAGMLGYFVLQPLTVLRFDGSWRKAALVPLIATVPLLVHALLAFAAGANLWPILLILWLPVATLYLLALAGIRSLVSEHAPT